MSNNLSAPQVADNQSQKETTINDAVGRLDAALTEVLEFVADGDFTVAADDFKSCLAISITAGAASAGFTVKVPAILRGMFIVQNAAGHTATVEIDSQPVSAPTVADAVTSLLWCDGVNVRKIA